MLCRFLKKNGMRFSVHSLASVYYMFNCRRPLQINLKDRMKRFTQSSGLSNFMNLLVVFRQQSEVLFFIQQ